MAIQSSRADGNAWQRSTSWNIQWNLLIGQLSFEVESIWLYWNLSSDFGIKIWTVAYDWGNLLTPGRNENQNTVNIDTWPKINGASYTQNTLSTLLLVKIRWSVERESGAVTPVWLKVVFFQSLITFFIEL